MGKVGSQYTVQKMEDKMIIDGQCAECGRDYRQHIEWGDEDLKDNQPCPSDDCPSNEQ
jgi:hypothetical protein